MGFKDIEKECIECKDKDSCDCESLEECHSEREEGELEKHKHII